MTLLGVDHVWLCLSSPFALAAILSINQFPSPHFIVVSLIGSKHCFRVSLVFIFSRPCSIVYTKALPVPSNKGPCMPRDPPPFDPRNTPAQHSILSVQISLFPGQSHPHKMPPKLIAPLLVGLPNAGDLGVLIRSHTLANGLTFEIRRGRILRFRCQGIVIATDQIMTYNMEGPRRTKRRFRRRGGAVLAAAIAASVGPGGAYRLGFQEARAFPSKFLAR